MDEGSEMDAVASTSISGEIKSRPTKKAKQAVSTVKVARDRRLFTPFRALGIITNHVPLAMQTRTPKNIDKPVINVITSLGRSWAMWDAAGSIRLLFVGPETPVDISSLLVQGNSVYAAAGNFVYEYIRGKEVSRLSSIDETASSIASTSSYSAYNVAEIIMFGNTMCGISEDGKRLFIWDLQAKELSTTIDFEDDFTASHIVHPATYLNKIVVTSKEGGLQIINVQTRHIVHTFSPQIFQPATSATSSAITAVVQSPAIDVLALGFNDGRIVIFDIRMGDALLEFQMSSDSPAHLATITSLSFRTDNEAQTLASSDTFGNIALWDLDNGGRLMSVVRRAHEQHIGSLQFFPGQPILISSGADNSIREWFFETPVSPPRLLKERSGHASPPSIIRYYGSDGKSMLSASRGDRSLRYTSIVRESRSFELSQGSGTSIHSKKAKNSHLTINELKLPPIERLAFVGQGNSSGIGGTGNASLVKRDWDDVLTAHTDGDRIAKTWSVENKRLGKQRFGADGAKNDTGAVKAVCVTACGNFGLVGFERHSSVIVWNMQSGIKRREFVLPNSSGMITNIAQKRSLHVTGIETDALNTLVIIATLKGELHFFDFHSAKHLESITLSAGIVSTQLQRDNNLLACVCDDLTVRLVDIETKRTVREFVGFRGRVIDMTFSNDSRWLLTTSSDSIVRTFDIPTGQLVDVFQTPSMATSISFSPTGDFLATSHVDSVGVYLWTNRAQFSDVSLRSIDEGEILQNALSQASLPTLHGEVDDELVDLPTALTANDVDGDNENSAQMHVLSNGVNDVQLDSSLVTLSAMPRHKWQTLINLETITARNKPKEPPKAPESAPFFLPTLPGSGADTRFDFAAAGNKNTSTATKVDEDIRRGRKLGFQEMEIDSELVSMLKKGSAQDAYEAFFSRLLSLTPSALDLEIRSLATEQELILFLQALTSRLRSRKDFEAVQAILNVFLSAHSEVLIGDGSQLDQQEEDEDSLEGMQVEGKKQLNGSNDPIQRALQDMLDAQLEETKAVGNMIRSSLGMVAWARGVPVV